MLAWDAMTRAGSWHLNLDLLIKEQLQLIFNMSIITFRQMVHYAVALDGPKQANRPPLGLSLAFLLARPPKLVGSAAPWFGVFTFLRPLPNFMGMTTGARHVGRVLLSALPVE